MKKILFALIIAGMHLSVIAQELMTIGEVFNFEIGDQFQTEGTADHQPPNADRITITGKYFSLDNDTLFYIRFHDSYYSEVIWGENPYLEYHFWTKTDTVFYSNLDSSLLHLDSGFEQSQYIETSNELCDSLINGCAFEAGPDFENDNFVNEYGKGLGKTYAYFYSGEAQAIAWRNSLFYYKKGGFACGVPDTLTVGIEEINNQESLITIFPNPSSSVINIKNETQFDKLQCAIVNSQGQVILSQQLNGKEDILNINQIAKGIYFLQIKSGNHLTIRKFIKK